MSLGGEWVFWEPWKLKLPFRPLTTCVALPLLLFVCMSTSSHQAYLAITSHSLPFSLSSSRHSLLSSLHDSPISPCIPSTLQQMSLATWLLIRHAVRGNTQLPSEPLWGLKTALILAPLGLYNFVRGWKLPLVCLPQQFSCQCVCSLLSFRVCSWSR